MSSPQTENGFIRIATGGKSNDVLMALIGSDLSALEWKIVMFIIRQTWGYGKKEDRISYSQFRKVTGASQNGVWKALNKLVTSRLLVTTEEPNGILYGLNKRFTEWTSHPQVTSSTSHPQVTRCTNNQSPTGDKTSHLEVTNKRKKEITLSSDEERVATESPALSIFGNETESVSDGGSSGGSRQSPASAELDRLFDIFEKLSGKKLRARNRIRIGHLKARLKEFTAEELELAWRAMAGDASLRGDNRSGVDYFSIEYALRVQYVERYLNLAKKTPVSSGSTLPQPKITLPVPKVTTPDGRTGTTDSDGRFIPTPSHG